MYTYFHTYSLVANTVPEHAKASQSFPNPSPNSLWSCPDHYPSKNIEKTNNSLKKPMRLSPNHTKTIEKTQKKLKKLAIWETSGPGACMDLMSPNS